MKRVLVTGAAKIRQAGVATIVYEFGKHLNEKKVVYDYLMQSGISDQKYRFEIENKGGRVYEMKKDTKDERGKPQNFVRWYSKILKENDYDTLHINCDSAFISAAYLVIARLCGVKHIIVHAHSTQIDDNNAKRRALKTVLHYLTMPIVRCADYRMACSLPAAEWMFGKKYISKNGVMVVHNGIEADKYRYSDTIRKRVRDELKLSEKKVIGFVGRLAYQKNPQFLLRVFEIIKQKHNDYALLFVGDGVLVSELKSMVNDKQLEDVLFLGNRNDVNELLQAFDIFALPSRFEGLGIVYIEAQAAGLPTMATYQVPDDACITDLMIKMGDNADETAWAEQIVKLMDQKCDRRDTYEEIHEALYDINDVAKVLEDFYIKMK